MKKTLILFIFLAAFSCKKVIDKSIGNSEAEKLYSALEQTDNTNNPTLTLLELDYPFLDSAEKNKFYEVLGDRYN